MSIEVKRLFSRRPTRREGLWAITIGCLLVALAVFIYFGYGWDWTGFQGNKFFNWLQILVSASIPVAVAIGTFALNRAAKRRDDDIETQRAEEASLEAYLDYMSGMLIDPEQPLRRSHMGDNLSVVARAQTLTVLGRLEDGYRKRSVLQFLYEAGLINTKYPVIDLDGANLEEASLDGANLKGAHLPGAILYGAILRYAQGLTQDQLEAAFGNEDTTLPEGIDRPKHWSASADEHPK
jgi:hypothetical protein